MTLTPQFEKDLAALRARSRAEKFRLDDDPRYYTLSEAIEEVYRRIDVWTSGMVGPEADEARTELRATARHCMTTYACGVLDTRASNERRRAEAERLKLSDPNPMPRVRLFRRSRR